MRLRKLLEACDYFYKMAMFVEDVSSSGNKMLIAYKSKIWIVDQDTFYSTDNDELEDKEQKVLHDIIATIDPEWEDATDNFSELVDHLRDNRPDILLADYDPNKSTLYLMQGGAFGHNPKSSILVKKIVEQLGIRKVLTSEMFGEEDEEVEHYRRELLGRLPDVLYHGTSSEYAPQILTNGLMPGASRSNYPRVVHHGEEVFLTAKLSEAAMHSYHTVQHIGKGFEVIFGFQIPDKSRLIPDYDIDVGSSQTVWVGNKGSTMSVPESGKEQQSMQLSREFGIVGYHGRIPANFIRSIHIRESEYYPNYTEVSKEELLSMIYNGFPEEYMEYMNEWDDEDDEEQY